MLLIPGGEKFSAILQQPTLPHQSLGCICMAAGQSNTTTIRGMALLHVGSYYHRDQASVGSLEIVFIIAALQVPQQTRWHE